METYPNNQDKDLVPSLAASVLLKGFFPFCAFMFCINSHRHSVQPINSVPIVLTPRSSWRCSCWSHSCNISSIAATNLSTTAANLQIWSQTHDILRWFRVGTRAVGGIQMRMSHVECKEGRRNTVHPFETDRDLKFLCFAPSFLESCPLGIPIFAAKR